MATGYTALQYLKECPVCREEFTGPRALPCDHLLCQDCIDHIKRGIQIKCPVCNTLHDVSKVRRDFRLMQFLDALKEENRVKQNKDTDDEPYCQVCSSDGSNYWCNECKMWLCNGCNRSHRNIPACQNHKTEPLSLKITQTRSQYKSTEKKIQEIIQNNKSAAQNIKDKILELEITQVEALAESNGLRSKCIDDINKYFDTLDENILKFIQDQISPLERTCNGLFSELNEIESKWNLLEQMIKDDSHKLANDGQLIIDQATQIIESNSCFEDNSDVISIKVVQGPKWTPQSAAILQMSGKNQTESQSQWAEIADQFECSMPIGAGPKSPTKPHLSEIANTQFTRTKEVDLKDSPLVVRCIDNKLYIGIYNMVCIYNLNLKRIHQWRDIAWGGVNDVACICDKSFVLACYCGLFHVSSNGKTVKQIGSGNYTSGVYHNGLIYAYKSNAYRIISYDYSRSWTKRATIPSPVTKGHNTISINDSTITICGFKELHVINHEGQVLRTYGTRGKRASVDMLFPFLCQEDDDGAILVADYNNSLKVLDKQQQWSIVNMEPRVHGPQGAVYVNCMMYVVSSSDKKLYSYKAT